MEKPLKLRHTSPAGLQSGVLASHPGYSGYDYNTVGYFNNFKSRVVLGAKRPINASSATKVNKIKVSKKGEKEFKELNAVIGTEAETDIYIRVNVGDFVINVLSHLQVFPTNLRNLVKTAVKTVMLEIFARVNGPCVSFTKDTVNCRIIYDQLFGF